METRSVFLSILLWSKKTCVANRF